MKDFLNNEIKLKDDECCIVFDFACYFPCYFTYEAENLVFDFAYGDTELNDKKINHRYPNRNYHTISRKSKRKVSKIGYPYIFKINEQGIKMLHIRIGLKSEGLQEKYVTINIPVETHMTKDKPICFLKLRYIFDKSEFEIESYCLNNADNHLKPQMWTNHDITENGKNIIVLNNPHITDKEKLILTYDEIVTPYPSSI